MSQVLTCYHNNYRFSMENHCHKAIEVNYVKEGTVSYFIQEQEIVLHKDDTLILNAKEPHRVNIEHSHSELISVELYDYDFWAEICPHYFLLSNSSFIGAITVDIWNASCDCMDTTYFEVASKYLAQVIQRQKNNKMINKIKLYISEHYKEIQDIKDMARHFHLSISHLQRVFRKESEIPIGEYIIQTKMKNAAYLLKNTSIPIQDIDFYVGMNTRQSFYHSFKKVYGMSPREFRKKDS